MSTNKKPRFSRINPNHLKRLKHYVSIGARVASLLVHLRAKPSKLDYLALSVTAIDAALDVWKEIQVEREADFYNYFDRYSIWEKLPYYLISIIYPMIQNTKIADDLSDDRIVLVGYIQKIKLGWMVKKDNKDMVPIQMYYEKGKYDILQKEIETGIWDKFTAPHLIFSAKGLIEDTKPDTVTIETDFITNLESRVSRFRDKEVPRGYLLEGSPGTGKSTAIQYLIHKMKLRSLRIDLAAFEITTQEQFAGFTPSIELLLRVLHPQAVIIDDMDRIASKTQPQLLRLLELMHSTCNVIFVSVNSKKTVLTPLLRPDRLDEHLVVPPLKEEVVLKIIGEEFNDIAPNMTTWPIIYLVEFRRRVDALGSEKARQEIKDLEARIKYAKESNQPVITVGYDKKSDTPDW